MLALKRAHLTERQAAEMLGVGKGTINRWSQGFRDPDDFEPDRLTARLHLTDEELVELVAERLQWVSPDSDSDTPDQRRNRVWVPFTDHGLPEGVSADFLVDPMRRLGWIYDYDSTSSSIHWDLLPPDRLQAARAILEMLHAIEHERSRQRPPDSTPERSIALQNLTDEQLVRKVARRFGWRTDAHNPASPGTDNGTIVVPFLSRLFSTGLPVGTLANAMRRLNWIYDYDSTSASIHLDQLPTDPSRAAKKIFEAFLDSLAERAHPAEEAQPDESNLKESRIDWDLVPSNQLPTREMLVDAIFDAASSP
ncbi:MAG: helix-turn-helix domain-containing protein [Bifidobacteriaceae bacterium]|jgi:transcriptional regulator with XRE-family HTH domain|nr:helix-turn-helix domain-containing protein [Bifidobacteriaceae bacterium]